MQTDRPPRRFAVCRKELPNPEPSGGTTTASSRRALWCEAYGEPGAQAGPAVAADRPSSMGGEASSASGSPSSSSSVRVAARAPHRESHSSAKAVVFSRRPPTPPVPPADIQQVGLAPVSDRDARPPPDANSAPHTKVGVTDFRLPKPDAADGFPYGSRFRSPQDARPIDTPGFTVTIPLRLP